MLAYIAKKKQKKLQTVQLKLEVQVASLDVVRYSAEVLSHVSEIWNV